MTRDDAFEGLVLRYTGRDMAYHARNKTVGLDFAREAFNAGAATEREACALECIRRVMGDNNREDAEARRCAAAIRARSQS